jgi:hypothetical protein
MIKLIVNENEYDMASNWDELSWSKYIKILELESKKSKYLSNLIYTQKFIAILCGINETILDDLEIEQLYKLEEIILKGFNPEELKNSIVGIDHFTINNIDYSFYSQNTINKITLGEQAWIETMKSKTEEGDASTIIKELAVLIRPATKIISKEGREMWKMDKFDPEDVEVRAKLLEDNLNIKDLLAINSFFLSGVNS